MISLNQLEIQHGKSHLAMPNFNSVGQMRRPYTAIKNLENAKLGKLTEKCGQQQDERQLTC